MFPIIVLHIILSFETCSNWIVNVLGTSDKKELIGYVFEYISIISSLSLGILVYFQSQRINNLEATQFCSYLAVIDVNYSFDMDEKLNVNPIDGNKSSNSKNAFSVGYFLSSQKKTLFTSIIATYDDQDDYQHNRYKGYYIPLEFVSKNQPLIVAMDFQSINIELTSSNLTGPSNKVYSGKFYSETGKVFTPLENDSHFTFNINLITNRSLEFNEIKLKLTIIAEDQNGYKQEIITDVLLNKLNNDSKYYLTHSFSKRNNCI